MRVGLLGGSFNPVHNMHLFIAQKAKEQYQLDEVYLLPAYVSPHKIGQKMASVKDRCEMLSLAVAHNADLKIEYLDIMREEPSYTYHTICQLQEEYPENEYFFIIGGDQIANLDQWYRIEELKQKVQFIGVSRDQVDVPEEILPLSIPQYELSSSYIRQQCHEGKSIRYLVPDAVNAYIQEKELYQ